MVRRYVLCVLGVLCVDLSVKGVAILGSTGSIGQSALAVVDAHADRLRVVALAAGGNTTRFAEQVARYRPEAMAMATGEALTEVRAALRELGQPEPPVAEAGCDGLIAV